MKPVLYRDCFGLTTNHRTSSIKLFAYLLISMLQSHAGWAQHPCGTVGRFPCGDGACISVAKVCNGVRDCRRGVDEIDCGARRTCRRDVFIANSNRYACRKSCTTDVDCRGARKRCVCDNECGKSCIYPGKICLDEPPVVEHGRSVVKRVVRGKLRSITGSYRYSDVATYECDVGYKLLGPRPRCTARGIWSDEAPVCVDITCRADVPIVRHAVDYRILRTQSGLTLEHLHTYTNPMVGDEIVYLCEDGFRLVGTLPVCTPELQFTEFTAKCVVLCYHERNADLIRKYGLHCGQACNSSSDCPQGDECICVDPCGRNCANTNADCPAAPDVPNASMTYEGAGLGKTARYRCYNGFYLESGRLSLHCSSSGTWLEQPPDCRAVTCGRPYSSIQATHGYAIGNYRSFGSNVTFECTGNRRLVGSRTRQCLGDGVWSGFLAVCIDPDEEVDCHHPGVPINGRLIGSDFSVGASVRFECDEHYLMYGWPEQECTEDRRWSGNGAPLCRYFKYSVSEPESVGILTSAISQMPAHNYRMYGRTIDVNDEAQMHEIYFVIDVSKSIDSFELQDEIGFAVALVKKMTNFKKSLKYAIMIFATNPKMLLSLRSDDSLKSDVVIDKLSSLLQDIDGNRKSVKSGTATTAALQLLKKEISLSRRQSENTVKTHVFMFTDGNHTTGPHPVAERQNIENEFTSTVEFYSITACDNCDSKAKKELKGLASKGSNFIHIRDYYLLSRYLNRVANVEIDYSKCGSAGLIGEASKVTSLGRAFGGENAVRDAWPWQAAIVQDDITGDDKWILTTDDLIGGGSIISEQWILTAAHVLHNVDSDTCSIFVGLFEKYDVAVQNLPHPIQRFKIESDISHPLYNHTTKNNDIALIRVERKIKFNQFVRPICLPCTGTCLTPKIMELSKNDIASLERCLREENVLLRAGEKTVVTGYGYHSDKDEENYGVVERPVLRQVVLQIANDTTCSTWVEEIQKNIYNDNNICTEPTLDDKPVDACKGDSGGPMIREVYDATTRRSCWVQIGIVSFGERCGTGVYPGYFTNVLRYVEWVNVTMGNSLSGP